MTKPQPSKHYTEGMEAVKSGKLQQAHASFHAAVMSEPNNPDYRRCLAEVGSQLAFSSIQLHGQALFQAQQCVLIDPDNIENWLALGNVANCAAHYDLAICAYKRATPFNKNLPDLYCAIAHLYAKTNRRDEAMHYYHMALEVDPNHKDTHFLLGCQYVEKNRNLPKMLEHSEKGIGTSFGAGSMWNAANASLALGMYEKGFRYFEARTDYGEFGDYKDNNHTRFPELPKWCAEKNVHVLVVCEWGLGDALQFARYIPLIVSRYGCKVTFECRKELHSLFAYTFKDIPEITVVVLPYVNTTETHKVLLMSLPYVFGTTLDTIPTYGGSVPFFHVRPHKYSQWESRLRPRDGRKRIGICWAGEQRSYDSRLNETDMQRSLPWRYAKELMDATGTKVDWYSLQKGTRAKDFEMIGDVHDFADTAGLMLHMDAIVTVDTSIVHLAGALGLPTYMLSRYDACWRWLEDREDSPWYPRVYEGGVQKPYSGVTVLRQESFGDWNQPIAKLIGLLNGSD